MIKHKSIQLLATFSEKEIRRLSDFLASPYHNTSNKISDLFHYIKDFFPLKSQSQEERQEELEALSADLSHQRLFALLFPDKEKSGNNLSVLLSQFHKLLERFMVFERMEKDSLGYQNYLLEEYAFKEGFEDSFLKIWDNSNKENQKQLDNSQKQAYQFRLESLLMQHLFHTQNRQDNNNLPATMRSLESYMLTEYLRYSLATINYGNILNESYSPQFLNSLLEYLSKQDLLNFSPLIQLYYDAIRCFTDENHADIYPLFKEKLYALSLQVRSEDAFDLYQLTINYLMKRHRKEGNLLGEIFEYYQDAERKRLFYPKNAKLNTSLFDSIVSAGVALANLSKDEQKKAEYRDWIRGFVQRNESFLPQNQQEYCVAYALAFISFSEGKYEEALKSLPQHSRDILSEFARRRLLVRIYVELEEWDLALVASDTSSKYIRRSNHISEVNLKNNLDFFRLTERLCKLKLFFTPIKSARLKEEIEKTLPVHHLWLLQQVRKVELSAKGK